MKIFVNSRFLTQKITGSQRFAIEISKQIKKLSPDRFVFIAPRNVIHKELAKELDVKIAGINTGHIWEQIDLPLYLKNQGYPLLLNLVNTAPIYYENKIITIMDVSWKHFPNTFSKNFYIWYKFLIPKILKSSKFIFTLSEFSKNDLKTQFNIEGSKIEIISCAVSDNFKYLNLQREKVILSVASLQPYKNIEGLVKSFILLKSNGKFSDFKLVLIGGYNKKVFADTNIFELSKNRDDIIFTGYLSDEKLVEYYNKAFLFAFPSFFEGFGIPPLEAMSCGCPCVVSNVASLPEVCGDAAYYVNPYSIEDIAGGIEKVLSDENLREDLIKKGFENVKRFSWEESAKKFLGVIKYD